MANEAYRAVFLRVHPTGKMVLSLTTEPDGNEGRYAEIVAEELGVPALDVKVVPGRRGPLRHRPRLQHEPVGRHARRDREGDRQDPGEGAAARGVALDAAPDTLQWDNGAFVSAADAAQAQTIADIALYAHGSGALPPGVKGGLDAQTVYAD